MEKSIYFYNFSDEDFVGVWNKEEMKIEAGESIHLPEYLAKHFAKHLVDRELIKSGKQVIDGTRQEVEAKCFAEVFESETSMKEEVERLNRIKKATKKTTKKVAKKATKKATKKVVKEEDKFEGK